MLIFTHLPNKLNNADTKIESELKNNRHKVGNEIVGYKVKVERRQK